MKVLFKPEITDIINTACLIGKVTKKDLLKQGRANSKKLFILVSVFFISNKYYPVSYILENINKTRTIQYHYKEIIRNQFFLIEPLITEIEKTINYVHEIRQKESKENV